MEDEKIKLNYNTIVIYKKKIDDTDPNIIRKIRYGIPTNIVDIELDTPDLFYDSKDCPNCGGKKSFKKVPVGELFVKGLTGYFIVDIDNSRHHLGRMLQKQISEINFIYGCDICSYAKSKHKKFISHMEVSEDEIVERNEG